MHLKDARSLWFLIVAVACGNSSSPDTDAGPSDTGAGDVHSVDAAKDVGSSDSSSPDASDAANTDDASDASDASDATDDSGDSSDDDASDGAAPDASDASILDAGKGCMGVFCIVADKCCNNIASVNYGKCEPISCSSCCM